MGAVPVRQDSSGISKTASLCAQAVMPAARPAMDLWQATVSPVTADPLQSADHVLVLTAVSATRLMFALLAPLTSID